MGRFSSLFGFILGLLVATLIFTLFFWVESPEVEVTRTIPVVAVNEENRSGLIGNVSIRLEEGASEILVTTSPFLETDIQESTNIAVQSVLDRVKKPEPEKDFIFTYRISGDVAGGKSAGAAVAILTAAAISGKNIRDDVIITGSVNEDGSIGPVSGLREKAVAAGESGYALFLVPEGQSNITYYEKRFVTNNISNGKIYSESEQVPITVDLRREMMEKYGMLVIEVEDIDEAMGYMLE